LTFQQQQNYNLPGAKAVFTGNKVQTQRDQYSLPLFRPPQQVTSPVAAKQRETENIYASSIIRTRARNNEEF
jgi:hypothetical protein